MKIPLESGNSLREFVKSALSCGKRKGLDGRIWEVMCAGQPVPKPTVCPQAHCRAKSTFSRHGAYIRQAIEGMICFLLLIYRFRCRQCGKTVSRPYSFLIPYKRFTTKVIGAALDSYGRVESTYHSLSAELSVQEDDEGNEEQRPAITATEPIDKLCPAPSTVFAWVDFVCKRVERLVRHTVKAFITQRAVQLLPMQASATNPNKYKAGKSPHYCHQKYKPDELNNVTYALHVAGAILDREQDISRNLRAYLMYVADSRFDLLSDVHSECQ
jgi:hypothetical protein